MASFQDVSDRKITFSMWPVCGGVFIDSEIVLFSLVLQD